MRWVYGSAFVLMAFGIVASCGEDDPPPPPPNGTGLEDQTGESCAVPADCYDEIAHEDIQGEVQCLTRVQDGYCTHLCTDDDDCCAVPGECAPDVVEVCGPFESTGLDMCFISCEDVDVGSGDPTEYCQSFHPDFICRSTGGGSDNKKVCVPGGGQVCETVDSCPGDWPYCCLDDQEVYRCTNAAGVSNRICMCGANEDCPEVLPHCCEDGLGGHRCYDASGAVDRVCF